MNAKEEFIQIYKENIHRDGADAFLEFLEGPHSDFFTAPASTRFHGNMEGGLCEHSVHVYHCLKDYLDRQRVKDTYKMNYSDETIAETRKLMVSGNKSMSLNLSTTFHLVMAKKVSI